MSYSPAETAQLTGFSVETLRYYERVNLLPEIERDSSGHRTFSPADLEWLEILRCLRDTGMPIARMRRYAELALADRGTAERLEILREHAAAVGAQIELLQQQKAHLDGKIGHYVDELGRRAATAP